MNQTCTTKGSLSPHPGAVIVAIHQKHFSIQIADLQGVIVLSNVSGRGTTETWFRLPPACGMPFVSNMPVPCCSVLMLYMVRSAAVARIVVKRPS